ncbi:MAG: hypothetical protein PHP02_05380 [Eubacteriales bacterium]|nr:hypothetical protein [Eubacteriales bacterium]
MNECSGFEATIDLSQFGVCKPKYWEFQKEERYWVFASPMTLREIEANYTFETHKEWFRRLFDKNTTAPYEYLDMVLAEDAFDNCEIMTGPKTNDGEKIIVQDLIEKYCPSATIRESMVRING